MAQGAGAAVGGVQPQAGPPLCPCPRLSPVRADIAQEPVARRCSLLCLLDGTPGTRCCRRPRCRNPPRARFPAWRGEGQPGRKRGGFCGASGPGAPGLSPQRAGADRALPLRSKPMPSPSTKGQSRAALLRHRCLTQPVALGRRHRWPWAGARARAGAGLSSLLLAQQSPG